MKEAISKTRLKIAFLKSRPGDHESLRSFAHGTPAVVI